MSESLSHVSITGSGSVLVTGGTGLVGSHLIKELLRQGKKVLALYRTQVPSESNPGVQWVQGDILDAISLEQAFKGVEQVYHCAAIISYNPGKKQEMFHVNINGTANVVNACLTAGVQKLCFVSSVAALGRVRENKAINELMNWTKETGGSNYGQSKYLAEMEVWRGAGEGLNAVVVNPSIILGAGDWSKGSTAMFKSAYNEFPWFTEGVTGFVDVQDLVAIMTTLMADNISGERFVVNAENRAFKDVFSAMAAGFGKKPAHKKVSPFIAAVVWRHEKLKSLFNNSDPLLTRETAASAQSVVEYDSSKLLKFYPGFRYTPINETIKRVCLELTNNYSLNK